MMPISIIILIFVLIAIAGRKIFDIHIPIWLIMAVGAIGVLLFQQITIKNAIHSISLEVMFYLFGVFVISSALELSGYLERLTDLLFNKIKNGFQALFLIFFILGLSSALLMNDTIAIVGTPIIIQLCRSHQNLMKPLLISLAFSITIGSTLSPIGNPQNLLIATQSNMNAPFVTFFIHLLIPTLLNLLLTYIFIASCFRKRLSESINVVPIVDLHDKKLALISQYSLGMMLVLIVIKIAISLGGWTSLDFNFSYIALIASLPILLLSSKRFQVLKQLDWGTLIFFLAMFILMQAVWDSGFFQKIIHTSHIIVTHIHSILIISTLLSQLISNVPLVALYLPMLTNAGASNQQLLALAAGSTIAGNLLILGAASNIIIIHLTERRTGKTIGFLEFALLGVPVTLLNLFVYWLFL